MLYTSKLIQYRWVAVLFSGILVTSLLAFWTWKISLDKFYQHFHFDASVQSKMIRGYLANQLQDFNALKRFIEAAGELDEKTFRVFANSILERRGIQAIEWVPVVPFAQRAMIEASAIQDGLTNYRITERDRDGELIPAGVRETYYPVYYVEPVDGNEKAIGFDLGSNPERLAAIQSAIDSRQPQATSRIVLVQERGQQFGFLVFVPVYQSDQLKGFVLGVFRVGDMINNALNPTQRIPTDLSLQDLSAEGAERILHDRSSATRSAASSSTEISVLSVLNGLFFPLFTDDYPIVFAGRQWNIHISSTQIYRNEITSLSFLIVIPTGFFISLLAALYLKKIQMQTQQLALRVAERTSELDRQRLKLKEINNRFELAANAGGIGVWDWYVVENRLVWDRRMYEIYRVSPEGFSGTYEDWRKCIYPDDLEYCEHALLSALAGEGMFNTVFRAVWPDGSVHHLVGTAAVERNDQGAPVRVTGVNYDVTERKQTEQDLMRAIKAAEAANETRRQFLANMSHELRTPLNGILGMTELVLSQPLNAEARELLGVVRHSGEHLRSLVDDILDFSAIEAGKLEIESAPLVISELIRQLLVNCAPQAQAKGVGLVSTIDPGIPLALLGDPRRLRQVLLNLIGNAIKFTARGEIAIGVRLWSQQDRQVTLQFDIQDTGIGIAPDKQRQIFQPFVQEDGSATRQHGGAGLGLSIASRLVKLMGGRLWVESTYGQGSIFHFTAVLGRIPLAATKAA